MPITLTIDLEDASGRYESDGRYVAMSRRILSMCDEIGCKATFFVVGRVAEAAPDLIREIALKGHEIASHSYAHCSLQNDTYANVIRSLRQDRDGLEQLAGYPVVGYRAPCFSLTPSTLWIVDALWESGFHYSSSVMPTWISRHGFSGLPAVPFLWPNGLIEFPLPTHHVAGLRLPYLGGIYLYSWPGFLPIRWAKRASAENILWTYAHPYDFDRDEPWSSMQGTPLWINAILRAARGAAERKVRRVLMACGAAVPLRDRLREHEYPIWGLRA